MNQKIRQVPQLDLGNVDSLRMSPTKGMPKSAKSFCARLNDKDSFFNTGNATFRAAIISMQETGQPVAARARSIKDTGKRSFQR